MTPKLIAFLLTLFANLAAGVILLFMMLLVMNGFSESDANWGLGVFISLTLAISVFAGVAAFLGTHLFIKKGFSGVIATLITIFLCSIVGVIAIMISSVLGIAIADFVRRNY